MCWRRLGESSNLWPVGTMLRKKLAQSAVAQQPYAPVSVRIGMLVASSSATPCHTSAMHFFVVQSDQSITSMEPSQASASGQPLIQASNESSTAAARQTEAAGKAAKVPFSALSNTTPSKQPFSALSNTTPSKQPMTPASKSHWRLEDGDRPSRALQVVHELHSRCVAWQACSLGTSEYGWQRVQPWHSSPARQGFLLQGCFASCCRYMKQTQRWRDYAKLFTFLGFVALFLSVLYLQRGAQTAYEVHPGGHVD